jgi:hypothetical protein
MTDRDLLERLIIEVRALHLSLVAERELDSFKAELIVNRIVKRVREKEFPQEQTHG